MDENRIIETELQQNRWYDLSLRTYNSLFVFLPVWFVISFWANTHLTHTVFFTLYTMTAFIISGLLYYLTQSPKANLKLNYTQLIHTVSVINIINSLTYGLAFAWLLFMTDLTTSQHYTVIVVLTAITVGLSSIFSIFLSLGVVASATVVLPSLLGLIYFQGEYYQFYGLLCTLLMMLIIFNNSSFYKTHLRAQSNFLTQKKHANRFKQLSRTDELTKIGNRFYFDQAYENAWINSIESQTPLSLIYIDVDFLKEVNDTYGYTIGDEIIKLVAGTLLKHVSPPNVLARYGGEEFAIALPNTDADAASALAKQFQEAIRDIDFIHNDKHIICSCSLSVASKTATAQDDAVMFIDHARKSLHQAKTQSKAFVPNLEILKLFETHQL